MENYVNVRPEHLNFHGYLFGGEMLKWLDEFAWMAASRDYPGATMVTVAIDNILFKNRVVNGSILHFVIEVFKTGTSSVTYNVEVFCDEPGSFDEKEVFSSRITFVNLDGDGKPMPLPLKTENT
ncbi:MAG: acyl-CoA thioesterase [Denitrovibrio sp.]|nr:MAG: acyl-CoA thioesterase [Denitrovibrio sp.]